MRISSNFPSCALLVFLPVFSFAQKESPDPTTFTTKTQFVQVPVIVQKGGKHVSALTKSDFVLQQDGKDQPIASFEEVHTTPLTHPKAGEEFRNSYAGGQTPQQITILAIDTVNTPSLDQAYFNEELKKYLSAAGSSEEPIGIVSLTRTGINVVHDFTIGRKSLLAALQKQKATLPTSNNDKSPIVTDTYNQASSQNESYGVSDPGMAAISLIEKHEYEMAHFQDRTSRIDSLMSLQQLAQSLKGIPGRKTLIWVGSGFPLMDFVLDDLVIMTSGGAERHVRFQPDKMGEALDLGFYTWKLLNDANVAVYPVDARRTVNTGFQSVDVSQSYRPSDHFTETLRQSDRSILDTFKSLASETGGKPCIYRTDLGNCIREAAEDNRDYYLLGFYVDKENKKPGYHKIAVKLDQKASLRYRQGFIIAEIAPDAARQTDLQLAMNSPFAYTALPFSGRFAGFTEMQDKKQTTFELRIPPESLTIDDSAGKINFDVVAIVRAEGGKEAARLGQRIDRKLSPEEIAEIKRVGIDYKNKLVLAPGDYGVWFVVRDNLSGRTGSIVTSFKVAP